MVSLAQRQQVVDVGQTVFEPVGGGVVDLGVFERCVAQRTCPIQGSQGASLGAVGQPLLATEIEAHAVGGDDHWCDRADAAHRRTVSTGSPNLPNPASITEVSWRCPSRKVRSSINTVTSGAPEPATLPSVIASNASPAR